MFCVQCPPAFQCSDGDHPRHSFHEDSKSLSINNGTGDIFFALPYRRGGQGTGAVLSRLVQRAIHGLWTAGRRAGRYTTGRTGGGLGRGCPLLPCSERGGADPIGAATRPTSGAGAAARWSGWGPGRGPGRGRGQTPKNPDAGPGWSPPPLKKNRFPHRGAQRHMGVEPKAHIHLM